MAALFGLEEFNTFATQFNDSLDTYLAELVGKNGRDLAERAKVLAGHKATLEGLPEKAKAAETRGAALLSKYPECKDLEEIKTVLTGPEGNGGKQRRTTPKSAACRTLKRPPIPEQTLSLPASTNYSG